MLDQNDPRQTHCRGDHLDEAQTRSSFARRRPGRRHRRPLPAVSSPQPGGGRPGARPVPECDVAVAEATSGNRAARGPASPVPVAAAPSAAASPPPGVRLVVPGELDAAGELLEPRERDPEPLDQIVAGAHRPVGDVAALREARVPERLHVVDAREPAPEAAHVVQGDVVALLVRVPAVHPEAEPPEALRPVEPIKRGGAPLLDLLPELMREPRDVASLHGVLPSSS